MIESAIAWEQSNGNFQKMDQLRQTVKELLLTKTPRANWGSEGVFNKLNNDATEVSTQQVPASNTAGADDDK